MREMKPTCCTIYLQFIQSLSPRVSGLLVAHHQEVTMFICSNRYVLYVLVDCQLASWQLSFKIWQKHTLELCVCLCVCRCLRVCLLASTLRCWQCSHRKKNYIPQLTTSTSMGTKIICSYLLTSFTLHRIKVFKDVLFLVLLCGQSAWNARTLFWLTYDAWFSSFYSRYTINMLNNTVPLFNSMVCVQKYNVIWKWPISSHATTY
jgi:hypothetical protein